MANDEKELDQEFIDSVNAGYLLGKYAPDFLDLLVQSTGDSKLLVAMKQGKELLDREQTNLLLPSWLKNDRSKKDKQKTGKPKEKDNRSDIEPQV